MTINIVERIGLGARPRKLWLPLIAALSLCLTGCDFEYSVDGVVISDSDTTSTSTQSAAADTITPDPAATGKARVMSYNIQYFSTDAVKYAPRLDRLRRIVSDINPTVVAVQEVDDRAAMELLFPPDKWQIVIDDDSRDKQDVAFAVCRPWKIDGVAKDLDADDQNFIAPGRSQESYFPNRRDGLFINVQTPDGHDAFTAISIHAKARVGGRSNTDHRREGAARVLADAMKTRLKGRNVVIMGDFNDTPDDVSLNILESGDPHAAAGENAWPAALMINLSQPLWEKNMVTEGANVHRLNRGTGQINNVYIEARKRNDRGRGRDSGTGPIMFDQILVSRSMQKAVGPDPSAVIYLNPVALTGPGYTRPSDHLPVYADIDLSRL